jgi:hypothetical protein
MKAEAWVGLLQRIPATYHDSVILMLGAGAEVMLQTVVSLEPDYMVIRGRNAGSTDSGRVFVVPFDHIEYVGFSRKMSEAELRAIFGPAAANFAEAPAPAADTAAAPAPVPDAAPPAAAAPGAPPEPPKKPAAISKTVLLARLRARLGQDGKPAGS